MNGILVERGVSPMKLEVLGVEDWAVVCEEAGEEAGERPRHFAQTESTYILEGSAELTDSAGQTTVIGGGDLVTFLPDTRCTWRTLEPMQRAVKTT